MVPATDKHYTAAIIERRDLQRSALIMATGVSNGRTPSCPLHVRGGLLHTREGGSSRVGWLKFAS
jgi:hypothetical protein